MTVGEAVVSSLVLCPGVLDALRRTTQEFTPGSPRCFHGSRGLWPNIKNK